MDPMNVLFGILLSANFSFVVLTAESCVENDLRKHLFKNYTSAIRSVNNSKCVLVTLNMKLMQLTSVDLRHQKITTQAYYAMLWRNDFLKWEPKDWNNIKYLEVHRETTWVPDIILKNNADGNAVTIEKGTDKVWIYHTGENSWYPKVMMISTFNADVHDFPFDKQRFVFHFGSWSLGENKLRIIKDDKTILAKYFVNSTEWDLLEMRKEIVRSPYDSETYSEIIFTYIFARKPAHCIITTILPCIMLMAIALTSYLLPPDTGVRIGVLIATLLAFTVFLVQVNAKLPRNSDTLPVIKAFFMVTLGECILCFFLTCFSVKLLDNERKRKIPPAFPMWVKKYIFGMKQKQMERGLNPLNGYRTIICELENKNKLCALKDQMKSITNGEEATEKLDTPKEFSRELNTVNYPQSINNNNNEEHSIPDDLSENSGIDPRGGEMTWILVADFLDKIGLYVFSFLFLITTSAILIPAYSRKYY